MENQEETSLQKTIGSSEVGVSYNRAVISHHIHQLKSHGYDDNMLMELARRLNSIAYAMGFKEVEIDTISSLAKWIQEQFGNLSMQDVALAFDLVTAKKIGNDIRHYATFSQQYIGDVLNAFKIYKAKQIKLFDEHKKSKEIAEGQIVGATPQEMYEGIKKMALEKGVIMKVADWTGAYNYAWKERLINRMNEKEREEYKEATIKVLESEKRAGIIPDSYNIDTSIQSECHKRILQVHFNDFILQHGEMGKRES